MVNTTYSNYSSPVFFFFFVFKTQEIQSQKAKKLLSPSQNSQSQTPSTPRRGRPHPHLPSAGRRRSWRAISLFGILRRPNGSSVSDAVQCDHCYSPRPRRHMVYGSEGHHSRCGTTTLSSVAGLRRDRCMTDVRPLLTLSSYTVPFCRSTCTHLMRMCCTPMRLLIIPYHKVQAAASHLFFMCVFVFV